MRSGRIASGEGLEFSIKNNSARLNNRLIFRVIGFDERQNSPSESAEQGVSGGGVEER